MSIGARHPVSKHTHERHCTIARRTLTAAVRRWGSSGLKWVTLRGKTNRNGREGEGARAVLFVESGVGLWVFMCETLRPALKYSHYVTVHTYTHTGMYVWWEWVGVEVQTSGNISGTVTKWALWRGGTVAVYKRTTCLWDFLSIMCVDKTWDIDTT